MTRLQKILSSGAKRYFNCGICGADDLNAYLDRIERCIATGAEILEIEAPFSDPISGTPECFESAKRAIESGITLQKILSIAECIRSRHQNTGIILAGYCNIFFQFGWEQLFCTMSKTGIDAIAIADLPFEERGEISEESKKYRIPQIQQIFSTTTPERLEEIAKNSGGFISLNGNFSAEEIKKLKKSSSLPLLQRDFFTEIAPNGKKRKKNSFFAFFSKIDLKSASLPGILGNIISEGV